MWKTEGPRVVLEEITGPTNWDDRRQEFSSGRGKGGEVNGRPKRQEFNPCVWEDTHSSILAWRIPWTEEPGGLQYMGSQRIGHHLDLARPQRYLCCNNSLKQRALCLARKGCSPSHCPWDRPGAKMRLDDLWTSKLSGHRARNQGRGP